MNNILTLKEERNKIGELLKELRNLRDKHKHYSIRKYYNQVCDRMDVLESKLFQVSCDTCKHNISSVCLECNVKNKAIGWEE